jgi:hypothetical protein
MEGGPIIGKLKYREKSRVNQMMVKGTIDYKAVALNNASQSSVIRAIPSLGHQGIQLLAQGVGLTHQLMVNG